MTDANQRKPLLPGDFGYLEWLETEWERAHRLEVEADRRRAREAGLAAVEGAVGGLLTTEDSHSAG